MRWKQIASFGKLISYIFQAFDRGCDSINGIWNYPVGLVTLSAYSSINSNVEDYETENNTEHKRKWQQT